MSKKLLLFGVFSVLFILSCDEENPLISDTEAPSVTVTFPLNNTSLSNPVTINTNIIDNSDISSVVFLINGDEVFVDSEEPYQYDWDICTSSLGSNVSLIINATQINLLGFLNIFLEICMYGINMRLIELIRL